MEERRIYLAALRHPRAAIARLPIILITSQVDNVELAAGGDKCKETAKERQKLDCGQCCAPENVGPVRIANVKYQYGMTSTGLVVEPRRGRDSLVSSEAKSLAELVVGLNDDAG